MTVYLDCNATTPIEPEVLEVMMHYLQEEFGNAGSRTHEFGARAKQAVERARAQVGEVVAATKDEIYFTSGATESNNLAILGMEGYGRKNGRMHIVSSSIEHKAVLEPLGILGERGFDITLVSPDHSGRVRAEDVLAAVRTDTLLVSVMHANNETGIIQPIEKIAAGLADDVYFHVDAAQTFGKSIPALQQRRIDLISISAHKAFGPKGVGALVSRRRNFKRPPLQPLTYGGGQERGLRPGTQPVHLIAGLGAAAQVALRDHEKRQRTCMAFRQEVLQTIADVGGVINGDTEYSLPHVVNTSLLEIDSEAALVALKGLLAVSNGSACTSTSYEPSHVLVAMGIDSARIDSALRLSWCHMTPAVNWSAVRQAIQLLR